MGLLYQDSLCTPSSLQFSQEEMCLSWVGSGQMGGLEPQGQAEWADLWGAALPPSPCCSSLGGPLDAALPPARPSRERVLQRQLRAREQCQELPVLAVCAVCGGRAGPKQVCGQQPGEVLRLQWRLQVLPWPGGGARGRRRGRGHPPTPALASRAAGAWLRMQGTSPSSSTRLSSKTQMVREGGWGQSGAGFSGSSSPSPTWALLGLGRSSSWERQGLEGSAPGGPPGTPGSSQ